MELTRFDPEVLNLPRGQNSQWRGFPVNPRFFFSTVDNRVLSGKSLQKDTFMSRHVVANLHKKLGIFAFVRHTTYCGGVLDRQPG
jgi:hypothetical protein